MTSTSGPKFKIGDVVQNDFPDAKAKWDVIGIYGSTLWLRCENGSLVNDDADRLKLFIDPIVAGDQILDEYDDPAWVLAISDEWLMVKSDEFSKPFCVHVSRAKKVNTTVGGAE